MGRIQDLSRITSAIESGFTPAVSPKSKNLISAICSYLVANVPGVSACEYDREFGFYRVSGRFFVYVDTLDQMAQAEIETEFRSTIAFESAVAELREFFAKAKAHELNEYTRRSDVRSRRLAKEKYLAEVVS
jgi:hypothetical protein